MRYRVVMGVVVAVLLVLVALPSPVYAAVPEKCNRTQADALKANYTGVASVEGTNMYSGYRLVDGHYDALVAAFSGGLYKWCIILDRDKDANTQAVNIEQWYGRVYVTVTVDAPDSDLVDYTQGGWLPTYGWGSGPQVAAVFELDFHTGNIVNGTFIYSKTVDGLTNSVIVDGVQHWDDKVFITGKASSYVLDPLGNPYHYTVCPRGSGFRYTMDIDMTRVHEVECNGVAVNIDSLLRRTNEIPQDLPEAFNAGGNVFLYCTDSGGIQVLGAENGIGYELFTITRVQIGNGLAQAVATNTHVKLGESGQVSLWALKSDELQAHTSDGYDFWFPRNQCGEPFTNGADVVIQTAPSDPAFFNSLFPDMESNASSTAPVYSAVPGDLNEDGTYTVKQGDTLYAIAVKFGVDIDELAKLNRIGAKNFIFIGQILKLPE